MSQHFACTLAVFYPLLTAPKDMAYLLPRDDCDSAYGGDDQFPWPDPMFPWPTSLAGTKRDASNVALSDHPPASAPRTDETGQWIDHDHQSTLAHVPKAACAPCPDGRPSKRRASAFKAADCHHSNASSGHQFPTLPFDQFCQGCDWEPQTCTSPCPVPCPGEEQCSPNDACWDPHCDQAPCADDCVDPDCKKTADANDLCFCQKCDARPCPLGDPDNECHSAHTAPTATGTIYCYDNAPCHFQEGHHGYNSGLSSYESYPCYSQTHLPQTHGHGTPHTASLLTPTLSPGDYTSLASMLSNHTSPIPYRASGSQCYLQIADEHCHIDNSCCHGESRACGDCPSAPQEHLDLWNASTASGNGLAHNMINFGLQTSQPMSISLGQSVPGVNTDDGNFFDPLWLLPSSSDFSGAFKSTASKEAVLGFAPPLVHSELESSTQLDIPSLHLGKGIAATPTEVTSVSPSDSQPCICKWEHGPGMLCLAIFDDPESLHKHIKAAHVDNCGRCVCQWEGCEVSTKDFRQRSKLARHLLGHAGYRPYACNFEGCDKTFATNQAKDNHERTHTGERPYRCAQCDYSTTTHTQLQTHIAAKHEGKKPHKCRFCDFSCADSSNLSKHERTHQACLASFHHKTLCKHPFLTIPFQTLRPYRCPHPGCTFKPDIRWENLKRHLRRSGHCPELLQEGSDEVRRYRENVKQESDAWHRRALGGGGMGKNKRRGARDL